MTRVIDTSVVVKWAVEEEGTEAALTLIGTDIIAPDLLKAELANALWKKVKRGEIDALQAAASFAEVTPLLDYAPVAGHADRALAIGLELGHPIYDCFFLALAEFLDTKLITSDARLAKACSGTPWSDRIAILSHADR